MKGAARKGEFTLTAYLVVEKTGKDLPALTASLPPYGKYFATSG